MYVQETIIRQVSLAYGHQQNSDTKNAYNKLISLLI